MYRLNVWFTAIIVLDANILLGLYRLAPEQSRKLLDILEALRDRIWIPRQFWEEYQRRRPEMFANISREYKRTRTNLQSNRDKSKNSLLHLTERYSFDSTQLIIAIDAVYDEAIGTLHSSAKEHLSSADFDEVDERIACLCAGRVGDPLPDSTIADIPSMWQWRLDRGIPPGLKDRKKRKPNRYGDLTGWLQIKRRAIGRDRPVIIVSDDVKAGDWFVHKNGSPSGPHPVLTRELNDEAGVKLYLYTSEQFMWLADRFLKWQRHVAASGEHFRRHTPTLLQDFSRLSAFDSIAATTARIGLVNGYTNPFSSLEGLTIGDIFKDINDSISVIHAFNDRHNHLRSSMARLNVENSYRGLFDSV